MDQLAGSMVVFGWTNPILVDENAGISPVMAGSSRPESSVWPIYLKLRRTTSIDLLVAGPAPAL